MNARRRRSLKLFEVYVLCGENRPVNSHKKSHVIGGAKYFILFIVSSNFKTGVTESGAVSELNFFAVSVVCG